MTHKEENNQRIIDNHGYITQNGDIVNFKDTKIENLNNISVKYSEYKIIKLQYENGILKNEKEVLTQFLSLNSYNFDFSIDGVDVFDPETINELPHELKMRYIEKSKSSKDWHLKEIREFIQSIFKVENFFYMYAENYEENSDDFKILLTNFLLKEKIQNNGMPNLDDFSLAIKFYKENSNFDFIKIFGYEFSRTYNLSKLISLFKIKFEDFILDDLIEEIQNHNHEVLSMFLNIIENYEECTLKNLYIWLQESNIKSNLTQTQSKTIDDLFDLAINGYFKDEDIKLWKKLKRDYKYRKSPNAAILKSFFNNHKSSEWTIDNLYYWLEENHTNSDLRTMCADSISEIFNLVLGDGYFIDEDISAWNDLQNLYIFYTMGDFEEEC